MGEGCKGDHERNRKLTNIETDFTSILVLHFRGARQDLLLLWTMQLAHPLLVSFLGIHVRRGAPARACILVRVFAKAEKIAKRQRDLERKQRSDLEVCKDLKYAFLRLDWILEIPPEDVYRKRNGTQLIANSDEREGSGASSYCVPLSALLTYMR